MSTVFTVALNGTPEAYLDGKQAAVKLTGPTSYTTGGVAFTFATIVNQTGARTIKHLIIKSVTGGLLAQWDEINKKIKLLYPTGGSAAPATVVAPTVVTTPDAGAVSLTGSAAKPALSGVVTAGTGKEVAATTDVSSIVIQALVQFR